ncbi:MAG TPA: alpha/beta hydrolase [Candidatus Limnocylindria bacterium]|nr:alpha/beta hydrolase [Candidatus Limnocylindria bacterium]
MRRPLRTLVVLVLLVAVGYLGISWKYADGVTRVTRDPLKKTPAYVQATYEDVSFPSRDPALTLRGWWFPAPGIVPAVKAVVMVHGKDQNRIDSSFDPGRIARALLADGWSVLLFEMRGHGQSDGLRWGLGQYEPADILGAIDLVARKTGLPRSRIATIGESMGGGSVLMTVGRDPSIGPVVTDSAYASAPVVVDEIGPQYSGLPSFFTPGLVLMARVVYGIDIGSVVPTDVVRAHPERPFFFIQCADDHTVALHHGLDLAAASANPDTQLWVVRDCGHVKAFITHPQEWTDRVLAFLDRHIADGAASR